jgi:uncharacterized membrane protein
MKKQLSKETRFLKEKIDSIFMLQLLSLCAMLFSVSGVINTNVSAGVGLGVLILFVWVVYSLENQNKVSK